MVINSPMNLYGLGVTTPHFLFLPDVVVVVKLELNAVYLSKAGPGLPSPFDEN